MCNDTPPRPAHLPAGYDENEPYEDEDLSTYPTWWRGLIKEFQEHRLRPYRPPRFIDGILTPNCVSSLESELSTDIKFKTSTTENKYWRIYVDGKTVAFVARTRTAEGYTLYKMTSTVFEDIIRSSIETK